VEPVTVVTTAIVASGASEDLLLALLARLARYP
jgi:hypothetical protein